VEEFIRTTRTRGTDWTRLLRSPRKFEIQFLEWTEKDDACSPKVDYMFKNARKKVRNLKHWIARKLGKIRYVQHILLESESELGISVTRQQVEELFGIVRSRGLGGDWWLRKPDRVLRYAKLYLPLDVTASAVAFCGDLVKALGINPSARKLKRELHGAEELVGAEELCSQVLTGNLSNMSSAPEWAVEAAQVAEMDGQQHPFGRLDGVAWKHSLKRVCHDECEALVQGIREEAEELAKSLEDRFWRGTVEDSCADHVVKHVEAEILGCCSKSCGWNGQFCAFFPFLNSTEQADWQAECCSERNILQGSSRQQMCDSTLSPGDRNKSHEIVDQRPNTAKDREILGQDENPASKSWNLCPPPINLHQIHYQQLFEDWKRMPLEKAKKGNKRCRIKERSSIGECKAFRIKEITDDEGRIKFHYVCWDDCNLVKPNIRLEDLADPAVGIGGFLYVHKDIYSAWK